MEENLHSVDSDDCDSSLRDKLARGVDKVLTVEDVHGEQGASDDDDDDDDSEVEENNELLWGDVVHWKKLSLSSSDEDGDSDEDGERESAEESLRRIYELAMSLPSPVNLVPALKGSREKDAGSQRKLTVTWAPGVYDPAPTDLVASSFRGLFDED